jgi:hypothetical protein
VQREENVWYCNKVMNLKKKIIDALDEYVTKSSWSGENAVTAILAFS